MKHSNIKKARKEQGISQVALADMLGVTQPTVSDWENGKKIPQGANILELSKILNVTTDYILGKTIEVPSEFEDVLFAFHNGIEDLTQGEIDEVSKFVSKLKAKR